MLRKLFMAIGIGVFTIIAAANLSFAPEAQAFGWGDIKDAGKAVGRGAKKAGKAVGRGGKAVGRGTKKAGKAVGRGGKAVGRGAKKAGKFVGRKSKNAAKAVWGGAKCVAKGGCATIGDPPTTTMTMDRRTRWNRL